jgi:hypothetical protein
VFSLPGVVALAGSRALPASGSALVVRVASDLAAGGASFAVGCCAGADAALLSAVPGFVPPSLVLCLSAFGPGGAGSGRFSAVGSVSAFDSLGGSVQWWAGGPASAPLRSGLAWPYALGRWLMPLIVGWWFFSLRQVRAVRCWLAVAPFRRGSRWWLFRSVFRPKNCRLWVRVRGCLGAVAGASHGRKTSFIFLHKQLFYMGIFNIILI